MAAHSPTRSSVTPTLPAPKAVFCRVKNGNATWEGQRLQIFHIFGREQISHLLVVPSEGARECNSSL